VKDHEVLDYGLLAAASPLYVVERHNLSYSKNSH
jgi:hypothetical protein